MCINIRMRGPSSLLESEILCSIFSEKIYSITYLHFLNIKFRDIEQTYIIVNNLLHP